MQTVSTAWPQYEGCQEQIWITDALVYPVQYFIKKIFLTLKQLRFTRSCKVVQRVPVYPPSAPLNDNVLYNLRTLFLLNKDISIGQHCSLRYGPHSDLTSFYTNSSFFLFRFIWEATSAFLNVILYPKPKFSPQHTNQLFFF